MISLYLILVSCLYRILVAEAGGAEAVRVTATAYCWREPAHRRWGDRNALGTSLRSRVEGLDQIAVDPRRIPLGSIVEIEGLGCRIATDTGGLIRGWRIDVHCQTLSGMRAWGMRAVAIKVIRRGWGGHRGTRERRPWAR
ncbi:MAG: 3D domain-containing protein [Verrucomicrobiae bacterium]|nr:3D domain-containing protein [Verrucomicrobiae bacterium]